MSVSAMLQHHMILDWDVEARVPHWRPLWDMDLLAPFCYQTSRSFSQFEK